jgi:hypothetical protein
MRYKNYPMNWIYSKLFKENELPAYTANSKIITL